MFGYFGSKIHKYRCPISIQWHFLPCTYIFHSAFPIVDTSHALLFHLTQVPVALVSLRVIAIVLACFDLLLSIDLVIVAAARVTLEAHCYP